MLFKRYPIPISGLILAIFALGNLLKAYGNGIYYGISIIGSLFYLLYIVEFIKHSNVFVEATNHPVFGSVIATFSMATMLFGQFIHTFSKSLGFGIWILGIILHFILAILFTQKHILHHFKLQKVFPSWYIVYVGMAVASVSAPTFQQLLIGQIVFWIAFLGFLVLIPVVLFRLFRHREFEDTELPILTIIAAPSALLLAGYLQSFPKKNLFIVGFLILCMLVFYLFGLYGTIKNFRIKFSPAYSAFTFPLVISAIAIKMANGFFIKTGFPFSWTPLVYAAEIIAVFIVLYVLIHYVRFMIKEIEK